MSKNDYPATSCLIFIVAVLTVLLLVTVFCFLLINWVLSVFNVDYALTWDQALAVSITTCVLNTFKTNN